MAIIERSQSHSSPGYTTECLHSQSQTSSIRRESRFARFMPQICFDSTLRFTVIRLLFASTVANLVLDIMEKLYRDCILTILVIVHHGCSGLGPRFPIPGIFDIIFIAAELSICVYRIFWIEITSQKGRKFLTTMNLLVAVSMRWIMLFLIAVLFLLRLFRLIDAGRRGLWAWVDVTRDHVFEDDSEIVTKFGQIRKAENQQDVTVGGLQTRKLGRPNRRCGCTWTWVAFRKGCAASAKSMVHVFTGRALWRRNLPGESNWIIIPRGLLAFFAMAIMLPFLVLRVILEPSFEIGLLPIRELKGSYRPDGYLDDYPMDWTVVIKLYGTHKVTQDLNQLMDVVYYPNMIPGVDYSENPPEAISCFREPPEPLSDPIALFYPFTCPHDADGLYAIMNFTTIWGNNIPKTPEVFIGNKSPMDVLYNYSPTRFVRGANLLALQERVFRQRLAQPAWSSFGLANDYDIFWYYPIRNLITDPDADALSLPTGRNFATVRISREYLGIGTFYTTVQDSRETSVLKGLSDIGGLGSFFSFICAFIFGSSLFRIVLGQRPLSPFGLVHSLTAQRQMVVRECEKEYAGLRDEIESLDGKHGFFKLMFTTLIDIDIVINGMRGNGTGAEGQPTDEKNIVTAGGSSENLLE